MLFRSFFTNSFGILISRILGFIRDLLTASVLGANIYSDIFFVAFKLPNLFRRIFAEGAFTQAFMPAFTKSVKKGIFSGIIFIKFSIYILILTLFVMIFAPYITKLLAFGFDAKTIEIATPLVRINFWYLILIFVVTFMASLLQYKQHFATTAFSTALLNIAMIISLIISKDKEPQIIIYYLSFGVIVGGFLQLISHVIALKSIGLLKVFIGGIKHRKDNKKISQKGFFNQFFHAILGSSTAQISAFIDTWLASFLAFGSISYLYYANRVFQLPLALFAIALSTTIFPRIARQLTSSKENDALVLLNKGFWFLFSLLCVSTLGGIILSKEIIYFLFQRGSFTQQNTIECSLVLSMYLVGLVPFGISRIFSLWLYASSRQKEAAFISASSLIVNIILSLILIFPMQAAGLALASSISGYVLLFLTIKSFGVNRFLDIINSFKMILLLIFLAIETLVLYYVKDILSAYL